MFTLKELQKFIQELAKVYQEQESYLTELDSAIGDADHGLNMNRGFKKVVEQLEIAPPKTIDELFKLVSMQLIKTVGGASGPLYGTFFLKASLASKGLETVDSEALCKIFTEGTNGVIALGKAELGDKTMIDTLLPTIRVMEQNKTLPVNEFLQKANEVAETSMKSTIELVARKGRASYLGERSQGHQDPGATSSYYLINTAYNVLR